MNLLLDTCSFLWIILEPERLSETAIERFTAPTNRCYLSAISAREISVKWKPGLLSLPKPPAVFIPEQRVAHGIESLLLSEQDALIVETLPEIHRDPFDRMLISQAIRHKLTILTPDPLIRRDPTVRTEW